VKANLPRLDQDELADGIRAQMGNQLQLGLLEYEKFVMWSWESFDNPDAISERGIRAAAARVWDERVAEQQTWTGRSDADRLEAAFAELDAAGVLARMNFWCCGSCASWALWKNELPNRPQLSGYVYFNSQTAERILDEGEIVMAHGSFVPRGSPGEAEADRANAERVLAVLRAHGLTAEAEGTYGIRVKLPDWRRRLPARPDPDVKSS